LRDGARRVNRAPALLGGALCLIFAAAVQVALTRSQGDLRLAFDSVVWLAAGWITDIVAQPTDAALATKLHIGWTPGAILGIAWIALLMWIFVSGGIIDRYARDRATHASGFFSASGVFFFRFLRLTVIQVAAYAIVLAVISQAIVASAILALCSVVVDYAKVRAVVEDRRSAAGAIGAAIGFLRRNSAAAATLLALNYALYFVLAFALERLALVAIAATLWVRLLCWASEAALFQMKLAHAGYVARAEPVWPESPEAEVI